MFNVVKNKFVFYIVSALVILAGIVSYFIRGGFTADIDFAGGIECTVETGKPVDASVLEAIEKIVVDNIEIDRKAVTVIKAGDEGTQAIIKLTETLDLEKEVILKDSLTAGLNVEESAITNFESVSPSIGNETKRSAIIAVIVAVLLMLIYISVRFEILSGCAAVCALIHDTLVMLSVYAILGLPLNTSFIAAMLTILGYSINATIVTFDRIRENTKLSRKEPFETVVNKSIWQTMARSINTTLTTLFTIAILYIVGVQSIKDFAFPIIIGLFTGLWSSAFLAGNFWVAFKTWRGDKNVKAN